MSLSEQSSAVFLLALSGYFAALLMLGWGWFIRTGLTMIAAAMLPLIWQGVFTDSDAPGFAMMFIFVLPLPLLLIAVGLSVQLIFLMRRVFARTETRPR